MKNILITGAATGIGLATARFFHARGWSVGLLDIDQAALAEAAMGLGDERVWQRAVDVSDEKAVGAAVEAFAVAHDGQLHCLFNNAGVLAMGRFEELAPEQHRRMVMVNVLGVIHCCYAAFPFLRQTPGAHVISMGSASALYGVPQLASYSASKFAVRGLTEALNLEWAEHGITVTDIMPPFVNTGMLRNHPDHPPIVGRMGIDLSPEQVAEAVWASLGSHRVHRPVGLRFAATFWSEQFLPRALARAIMAWLSRPAGRDDGQRS
jgi:NAD(P)-dependent dehydrogenase (short-subunit alcohol dehydrogenase family)